MSGIDDLIKGAAGKGALGSILGGLTGGGSGGGLGSILGGLTGGGSGRSGGGGGILGSLVPLVAGMLTGGGLNKLLSGFKGKGMASQADSWVARGDNEAISAEDVRKVVPADELTRIANELGVSEDEAAAAVAQTLPAVVDHVTPEGAVPAQSELETKLEELKKLAQEIGVAG